MELEERVRSEISHEWEWWELERWAVRQIAETRFLLTDCRERVAYLYEGIRSELLKAKRTAEVLDGRIRAGEAAETRAEAAERKLERLSEAVNRWRKVLAVVHDDDAGRAARDIAEEMTALETDHPPS